MAQSALIKINLDDNASEGLDNIGRKAGGLSGVANAAGFAIAGIGAAAVGGAVAGIAAYSDFDTAITNIEARTKLSESTLASVRQTALDMGRDTKFSATQAAEGMLELITSGSTAEEAIAAIPNVLNLAAAAGLELGTSADGVTDIMAQFGLGIEDAETVVNSLVAAAGSSSATVDDLIAGFTNVGPVAQSMGLTVAETAAALAVLAENGLKGAVGGTALKSALQGATATTASTQGAWDELGTSFYDADGGLRSLDAIIKEVNASLADRSPQEQNEIMTDLLGSYGILAGKALLASDGISGMQEKMDEQNTAADVAETQMDTFSARIDSLGSSLETLGIQVMGPFVENHLKPLIEHVTEALNAFNAWSQSEEGQNALEAIREIVGNVLTAIGDLISDGFNFLQDAWKALQPVVSALANALRRVAGWVTEAFEAFGAWAQSEEGQTAFENVKTIAEGVLTALGNLVEDGFNFLGEAWEGLQPVFSAIGDVFSDIGEFVGGALTAFAGWLESGGAQTAFENVKTIAEGVLTAVGNLIENGFNFLGEAWVALQPVFSAIGDAFRSIGEFVGSALEAFGGWVDSGGAQDALENVGTIAGDVKDTVVGLVEDGFTVLAGIWESLQPTFDSIIGGFQRIVEWVVSIVQRFMPDLGAIFSSVGELVGAFGGFLQGLYETFFPNTEEGLGDVGEATESAGLTIDLLGEAFQAVETVISTVISTIQNIINGLIALFQGDFRTASEAVQAVVKNVWNGIVGTIERSIGLILIMAADFIGNLIGGLWDGLNTVVKLFQTAFFSVRAFVNNIVLDILTLVQQMMQSVADSIKSFLVDTVKPIVDLIAGTVADVGGIPSQIKRFIEGFNPVVDLTSGLTRLDPSTYVAPGLGATGAQVAAGVTAGLLTTGQNLVARANARLAAPQIVVNTVNVNSPAITDSRGIEKTIQQAIASGRVTFSQA